MNCTKAAEEMPESTDVPTNAERANNVNAYIIWRYSVQEKENVKQARG
jgi:hypothetical protein